MSKLIQILVEGSECFQITFKESSAIKLPETAEFLQKGFAVGCALPTVGNGEVNEFLHPLEGFLRVITAAFGEPFQYSRAFAANMRHLFWKCQFTPSAIFQLAMLHKSNFSQKYIFLLNTIKQLNNQQLNNMSSYLKFLSRNKLYTVIEANPPIVIINNDEIEAVMTAVSKEFFTMFPYLKFVEGGPDFPITIQMKPQYLLAYLAVIVIVGVLNGIIPAWFASRVEPMDVVKGTFKRNTKMVFNKVFIVIQNALAVSLSRW